MRVPLEKDEGMKDRLLLLQDALADKGAISLANYTFGNVFRRLGTTEKSKNVR